MYIGANTFPKAIDPKIKGKACAGVILNGGEAMTLITGDEPEDWGNSKLEALLKFKDRLENSFETHRQIKEKLRIKIKNERERLRKKKNKP